MRVAIVLEQRFVHTRGGEAYTDSPLIYAVWTRYLEVFEEVLVVGRSREVDAPPDGWKRVDGPGVRLAPLPYFLGPLGFARRAGAVTRAVANAIEPTDAVILRAAGTLATVAEGVLRARGQRFAVEAVSDPETVFGAGAVQHPLGRAFRRLFADALARQCRSAVAVQYVTREALQRRYPAAEGAPAFGVSDVYLPPEAFAAGPRAYTGPSTHAVLVGSLEQWYKAPDVVLRALARLKADGVETRFTLVGDGKHRAEVEALARELGVADRAAFVGHRATPAEVRRDLVEADLFLLPSRAEGLPRALLEAMALGLPAIGSTVGGIPELLPPECLVPPGDDEALARVWKDLALSPEKLRAASERNLALARGYGDDVLAERRRAFLRAVRAAARPASSARRSHA